MSILNTRITEDRLKSCPCCGSKSVFGQYDAFSTDSSFDTIQCSSEQCGIMLNVGDEVSEDDIEVWNKRV